MMLAFEVRPPHGSIRKGLKQHPIRGSHNDCQHCKMSKCPLADTARRTISITRRSPSVNPAVEYRRRSAQSDLIFYIDQPARIRTRAARLGRGIREVVKSHRPFELRNKIPNNWIRHELPFAASGKDRIPTPVPWGVATRQQRSPFFARPDLELLEGRHGYCTRDIRMSIDPDHPCSMQSILGALRSRISGSWVALPRFRETQL